jgi:hypothetical protein
MMCPYLASTLIKLLLQVKQYTPQFSNIFQALTKVDIPISDWYLPRNKDTLSNLYLND